MSKITKINVEVKKSRDFQTYGVSLESEGPFTEEEAESEIRKLQAFGRKLAKEQIDLDRPK